MNEEQHDDWNPLDESTLEDQRRAYDEMRERCPVAHSEFMGWSLFRHEDVAAVLANSESYSNVSRFLAIPNGMDPPIHGKYRQALAPNFDQEQMTKVEPRVREIAATLLGSISPGSEVEFIDSFATPFALKSLCAMLGWPERLWECLGGWVHGSQQAAFSKDSAAGKALASLFSEHVKANLNMRRAIPSDTTADATDALLATEVDGTRLDDDQIVSILRNWRAWHCRSRPGYPGSASRAGYRASTATAEQSCTHSRSSRRDSAGGWAACRQPTHHDAGRHHSGAIHTQGRAPDADVDRRQS